MDWYARKSTKLSDHEREAVLREAIAEAASYRAQAKAAIRRSEREHCRKLAILRDKEAELLLRSIFVGPLSSLANDLRDPGELEDGGSPASRQPPFPEGPTAGRTRDGRAEPDREAGPL